MVIEGGEIYSMALPKAAPLYLTRVHTNIDGDTFFPALGDEWEKESSAPQWADEKHAFNFDFEIWQRKHSKIRLFKMCNIEGDFNQTLPTLLERFN